MNIIQVANFHARLSFSLDELITLSNVVNELCYGINISNDEIEIRIGDSHENISVLLTQLLDVIEKIENHKNLDSLLIRLKKFYPSLFEKLFNSEPNYNIAATVNY